MPLITTPKISAATYLEVLVRDYPGVNAHCLGDGSDYDSIVTTPGSAALPAKAVLDERRDYYTRLNVWRAIQAERDARRSNGVYIPSVGHWFHSDDSSRIQQLALVIFGASLPQGIIWKTLDGAFIPMTNQLAIGIFQASAAQDIAIFTAAEQHKAIMAASPNPVNYDFSSGWPPTYTGSLLL